MNTMKLKSEVSALLSGAGIMIDGTNPWDIKVYNDNFYFRAVADGSLGIGEAYIENWWDSPNLDGFFTRLFSANVETEVAKNRKVIAEIFRARIFNLQSKFLAFANGTKHYDIGNDLFMRMLDSRMVYTCAYWKDATTLDQAQENKLDLSCKKLKLEPGMSVLDIGCGWGSFAKYAAEKYNVNVTGITVSKEQVELGRKNCEGLPVEIKLMDYRDLKQRFDRVV